MKPELMQFCCFIFISICCVFSCFVVRYYQNENEKLTKELNELKAAYKSQADSKVKAEQNLGELLCRMSDIRRIASGAASVWGTTGASNV